MWNDTDYNEWSSDPYPMNGEEIAEALNYSRQNISQLLKRALGKFYFKISQQQKDMSPFEIAVLMSNMLKVSGDDISESELKKFFKLFPVNIRSKIKKDAAKKLNIM